MEGPFGLLKCFPPLLALIPESTERSVKYRREIRFRHKWRKAGESKIKHIFMFPSPPAVAGEIKQNQEGSKIKRLKGRHEQGSSLQSFPHYFACLGTPFPTAHLFARGSDGEPGRAGTLSPHSLWKGVHWQCYRHNSIS